MKRRYFSVEQVLADPIFDFSEQYHKVEHSSRVTRSTRLEDMIYHDFYHEDTRMKEAEQILASRLSAAQELTRDVFQMMYSMNLRLRDAEELTISAREYHARILEQLRKTDDFQTIKELCEGRDNEAYEASVEFAAQIASRLDELLKSIRGENDMVRVLERLTAQRNALMEQLAEQVQKDSVQNTDEVCRIAAPAASKIQQVRAVGQKIHTAQTAGRATLAQIVHQAAGRACEQAELTKLSAIGCGTTDGQGGKQSVNRKRIEQMKENAQLLETVRQLGRLQEMLSVMRKNSYHYGHGVKYSLTLGKDLARILSGEFALLAAPETVPLFVRRYMTGQLKQYARREPIRKGRGDIIVCLDESSSTCGENAVWGKAIALALLDLCAHDGRRFALIHFSSASQVKTDLFLPEKYTEDDFWEAAVHFFDGGTDFEAPLREARRVISAEDFENTDVVFITDGCCNISEEFLREYRGFMEENHITMQGILLDIGAADAVCLGRLCHQILSTTTLQRDHIFTRLAAG